MLDCSSSQAIRSPRSSPEIPACHTSPSAPKQQQRNRLVTDSCLGELRCSQPSCCHRRSSEHNPDRNSWAIGLACSPTPWLGCRGWCLEVQTERSGHPDSIWSTCWPCVHSAASLPSTAFAKSAGRRSPGQQKQQKPSCPSWVHRGDLHKSAGASLHLEQRLWLNICLHIPQFALAGCRGSDAHLAIRSEVSGTGWLRSHIRVSSTLNSSSMWYSPAQPLTETVHPQSPSWTSYAKHQP